MTLEEAIKKSGDGEKERAQKREEMKRLIRSLSDFEDADLGSAIKAYVAITQDELPPSLTDAAERALDMVAQIQILELEC